MNEYYVYRHVNKTNNKQYIGITKQLPEHRWGVDGVNYKSSPYFYNAIQKYGWDNFNHEIIFSGLSKEDACTIEKLLIKGFQSQSKDFGYNIMEGGSSPSMPTEIREYMSKVMIGNKNGLGKPCSEEKKQKISQAQKGKTLTEEHKQNISKAKKGKTHKSISEEARKKIADAHNKKQVYCLETDTIYPSIQECARQLKVPATTICKICKGKGKSIHGYHLKYAN